MTVGGDLTHARAKEPLPMLGYGPRFCGTFHGMSMHQEWFRFDAYPLLPAFVLFRFEVRETVCDILPRLKSWASSGELLAGWHDSRRVYPCEFLLRLSTGCRSSHLHDRRCMTLTHPRLSLSVLSASPCQGAPALSSTRLSLDTCARSRAP